MDGRSVLVRPPAAWPGAVVPGAMRLAPVTDHVSPAESAYEVSSNYVGPLAHALLRSAERDALCVVHGTLCDICEFHEVVTKLQRRGVVMKPLDCECALAHLCNAGKDVSVHLPSDTLVPMDEFEEDL